MKELLVEEKANLLKALGHPVRISILQLLRDGEKCVCEILMKTTEKAAYLSGFQNVKKKAV